MTREQYMVITGPLRKNQKQAKIAEWVNRILTAWIFCSYPCLLLFLFLRKDSVFLRTILVPLVGFIVVSVFRYLVNRKRPYEQFNIPPVIPKKTKGKSFPSRHVFSAMIIALTVAVIPGFFLLGIFMCIAAGFLGVIRVGTGIHYPSDVVAGIAAAILVAVLGFTI